MPIKWLFLDFDNTLMATEKYALPPLIARFNELYANQIGRELTIEEFKTHFHGQGRETLCENLSAYFKINVSYSLLYEGREGLMLQQLQQIPHGIEMAPNLLEVLEQFVEAGKIIALVTNNPIQRALGAMRFASNKLGDRLAKLFGTAYFEAMDKQKPDPAIYLLAIKQLDAILDQSIAVEDSVTGAKAAIAAKLPTFGFTGFSDNPEQLKEKLLEIGCIDVFDNWIDFPKMLSKTFN